MLEYCTHMSAEEARRVADHNATADQEWTYTVVDRGEYSIVQVFDGDHYYLGTL